MNLRNIAIIAHVDHGKTTLVDCLLRQSGSFRMGQQVAERAMDSGDIERERGITILAKCTSVQWKDTRINIVDTPGHADFGGQVERTLNMADAVILLVDAREGPMPQTRFVLRHALHQGLKAILVVNKVDRPAARPDWVTDQTLDLFLELGASDEQCDFPILYTRALEGRAGYDHTDLADDLGPLFETILKSVPPPVVDRDAPPQLLVTTLQYSNYVGKIAVGVLLSGELRAGQPVAHIDRDGVLHKSRIGEVFTFRNLERQPQEVVTAGSIIALSGIENVGIGDTITDIDDPRPLPRIEVEQPTVRMTFGINTSPFAGREGRFLTSRQIRDRLHHELEQNVALRVEDADVTGQWAVSGRGELHLAILIETMRREGYEFSVSQPEVIYHEGDNGLEEPFEEVYIEVPSANLGAVSEMLGRRRGRLTDMRHTDSGIVHCTYVVPTRGMLGFRNPFLTSTRGNGIYHTLFHEYAPFAGAIDTQDFGSLVSGDTGIASAYSLTNLKQRGSFFIPPGTEVYDGQVIGQHIRSGDLLVNPTKRKPGTGHRAAPSGDEEQLPPHRIMSLDDIIEYLSVDELMEVTPGSLRIRKKELQSHLREREARQAKFATA